MRKHYYGWREGEVFVCGRDIVKDGHKYSESCVVLGIGLGKGH